VRCARRAAVLVLLAAARAAAAPDLSTAPARIGYFHGGRTNMFYRAYVHGCFDAAGTGVELYSKKLHAREFIRIERDAWLESGMGEAKVSGVQLVDKIASGEFDGGTIGEASFLDAVQRGLPVVAVALLGHQTKDKPGHAIILRRGLKIAKPADLKGRTLISRRAGPMDEALLREFVAREGLDPDKDVKILTQVDEDDSVSLLASGRADGGFYHLLLGKLVVERGLGDIYRPMDWENPEILQALLVFNADYLKRHPDRVQAVVDGYVARIAYEHALPEEKRDRSGMTGMMMEEDYRGLSIPTYDDVPRVRPELLRQAQDLLLRYGGLKSPVDPAAAIDGSFVAKAAADLRSGKISPACDPHARTPFRGVLLLRWDGARPGPARELLARGKLPNLRRLLDDGRWVDVAVSTGAAAEDDVLPERLRKSAAAGVVESGRGPADRVGTEVLDRLGRLRGDRFFLSAEFEESPARDGGGLLELDAWLGRIRARLAELKLDRQTLIYLDSGGGFLITNDPAVRRTSGDGRDAAATILDRLGANPRRATPPPDGRSLLRD
jgi:ABC-type nitrate/sulfonate/bicarbonate transport system substrate-binding protein